MIKNIFIVLVTAGLFSSCASEMQKKVLVMGKGDLQVNGNKVTMLKGSGYAEKEVLLYDKTATELTVETEAGTQTINIPAENGYYILNLKADTIAGSLQVFGKDLSNSKVITQEELKIKIDSIGNLTMGKNINGKTNFMITPNQVMKISDNTSAQVFGPYRKIPSQLEAGPDDKDPEIYKFYTNEDLRELMENLKKLTF